MPLDEKDLYHQQLDIVEGTQKLFEANKIQEIYAAFGAIFSVVATYDKAAFSRASIQIDDELDNNGGYIHC